jgi:hypothetical protein
MANPFKTAFTNYENSGNQKSLGTGGGFNPNDISVNSAPWTPPPPTGGGIQAQPLPTIPFGSYGSGAEAPAQTAQTPAAPVQSPNPPVFAFGAEQGGAIPALDAGGDPSSSADNGGYYSGKAQDNYTVELNSALGDVMDTLNAARDQASRNSSGDPTPAGMEAAQPEDFGTRMEGAGVRPSTNIEDNRQGQMHLGDPAFIQASKPILEGVGISQFSNGGSVGTKAYQDGGDGSDQPDPSEQPAIPDPSTGGDPSALEKQHPQAQPNPSALMRYASGADAVSPDVAAAAEQQVDPNGQMDPAARTMAAISAAAQQGNQKQAIGLLQHNRNMFNTKRHAARAALDKGNHQEAVRLANSAMQHVPNGHSVHITAHGHGVHIHSHSLVSKKGGK